MDFKKKSVEDMLTWLENKGYSEWICESFEENEIDGHAFLLLTKKDMEELVKQTGPRVKLMEEQQDLLKSSNDINQQLQQAIMLHKSNFKSEYQTEASYFSLQLDDGDNNMISSSEKPLSREPTEKVSCDSDDSWNYEDDYTPLPQNPTEKVSCDSDDSWNYEDDYTRKSTEDVSYDSDDSWNYEDDNTTPDVQQNGSMKQKKSPRKRRKHRKFAKCRKMSKPLPQPFHLPENFPESVEEEMETGQLTAKERKRFMLTVANAIFDHTMYPSKMEYNHVAEQIIQKYSFMGDKKGCHDYIVKVLKKKMSYLRAKAHATRKQRDDQKPPRKKKLSIFAPKFPALHQYDNYNNETSAHERNLIALQEEEEKLHPNEDIVTDLMKNTFFIRRQNILKASTSVTNLLRIYPSLRNYNQIIKEFNRIVGKDMQAVYNDVWSNLRQSVLVVAAKERSNRHVQEALELTGHHLSDEHQCILALYCLCYLLRDVGIKADHQQIINFIPEETDINTIQHITKLEPTIVITGSLVSIKDMYLVIQRQVLCKIPKIKDIVLILLASFYVFNMHYTRGFSNLFMVLEHYIMGRTIPKSKSKVNDFIAQLASTHVIIAR